MSRIRLLVPLLAFAIAAIVPLGRANAVDKLVTVTGEASVAVAPDMAVVRIGVSSQGKNARDASNANAKTMTAVIAAIKNAGLSERDIETSQLSLQPQYDQSKTGTARLTGFQATNQVTLQIRTISNLATIVDHAIAAGANEMSGIEFLVSRRSSLLDQARADAIADAHRKAEIYAKAAGVKLGSAVAITDEGASPPPRPMQAMRAGAVPVAPGEQTLRVLVTVSYELNR
ncbi:MAG TPA: SIMPL domain-containing protein [Pseudolabrys sp.]|nr:SIMPL domain-containing protein [Pseudolabrys sp.]